MPASHIAVLDVLQLGEPAEHRGVSVAPLFTRAAPVAEYVALDEALDRGFVVREVDPAGSVPELVAENPLGAMVLLHDGQELVGARQNRILNVTVLVPARSAVRIPVSCVEQGRWSESSTSFAPAAHTSSPDQRRHKWAHLAAAPLARGAAQHAVWSEIAARAERLGVHSPTGAHADIVASRAAGIASLSSRFPLEPGQCGMVLAIAGRAVCLDWVSRPDAFGSLHAKLLSGYMLDAVERLDGPPAPRSALEALVAATSAARQTPGPTPGAGADLRLAGDGIVGSGLALDGELVQLSAYADGAPPAGGRPIRGRAVARPSRRAGRGR